MHSPLVMMVILHHGIFVSSVVFLRKRQQGFPIALFGNIYCRCLYYFGRNKNNYILFIAKLYTILYNKEDINR